MITLINDDFAYSALLEQECRKVNFDFDYFKSEFNKENLQNNLDKIASKEAYICDQALATLDKSRKNILSLFENIEVKTFFTDFNVAIYDAYNKDFLHYFAKKAKANIINYKSSEYENAARILHLNKDLAFKYASNIILDAYDNGADFMLVADSISFKIFDTFSKDLMRASNRDFDDFYILHLAEFLSLCKTKIPDSLKQHQLKVSLV